MFGLNLLYIFSIFLLICFGGAFFTTELYFPKILSWKAAKLYNQSQVYLNQEINNIGGLLDDGVKKAKIAHLLDLHDEKFLFNFLRLQFKTVPAQALVGWSKALHGKVKPNFRAELLEKSFEVLRNSQLANHQRKIGAEIAFREIELLNQNNAWAALPENKLKFCELLAETGKPQQAMEMTLMLIDEYPSYPEAIFLLTRLSTHLEDGSKLVQLGRSLANLASQQNDTGITAIRHMTLLHLLNPLSPQSLEKCIELLNTNPSAKPIDFMRIHALRFGISTNEEARKEVVLSCASLFDLGKSRDLFIFNQWLARLGDFESIVDFLPSHLARTEENLFKLRMSALAKNGDFEKIHAEIAQATLIPSEWKLVIESRAFAMTGHFEDAISSLDRLIPIIESDPRDVAAFCEYLESSNDIRGLCHMMEYFSDKPIHAKFALSKLIQHRAGSAKANVLVKWLEKLSEISPQDVSLQVAITYLKILNPELVCPSAKLSALIVDAQKQLDQTSSPQARIALALGHLRNNAPDVALVALGSPDNWRSWADSRPAWAFLASQVYRLNHDSEKSLILRKNVDLTNMDFAERHSLKSLFPEQIKF